MRYCGMDVGGLSSYVYVTDEAGRKVWGGEVRTAKKDLLGVVRAHGRGGLKVAIEAGNQTAWIYDALAEAGAEVTVVNPEKVRLIAESRKKTDKVDAKILCELLRLGGLPEPVHMPSQASRELRGLLVARRQLVRARAKLAQVARGMLKQEGIALKARALNTQAGWETALGGSYKGTHLKLILEGYYHSFRSLTESMRKLEAELKTRGEKDARVELLKTMPCVGLIAALTLVAAVDDESRFSSSRKLIGYSGLAPTVRQSGERTAYGPISRAGRKEIRAVWVQIAHLLAQDKRPASRKLRNWFERVARRRGKKTAVVALARRMLAIAFQMLRTGEVFDARRLGRTA